MLGIAFEGCGCRAAFHVGVIEWLVEHDLMPEAVSGASSGGLIAGAFAIGRAGDLRAVWKSREPQPATHRWPPRALQFTDNHGG